MSTDRELLERAARAAGMDGWVYDEAMSAMRSPSINMDKIEAGDYWDPLTYDDEALRLSVKLRIDIEHCADPCPDGVFCMAQDMVNFQVFSAKESYGSDPAATTRRTIVRVAAELAP